MVTDHSLFSHIKQEWQQLLDSTSTEIRNHISAVLETNKADLQHQYLAYLRDDPKILEIIPDEARRKEFSDIFINWVSDLLSTNTSNIDAFIGQQKNVGDMMARIGYPPHAVSRGTRKLKLWFIEQLARQPKKDIEYLLAATKYCINLIDLSVEVRAISYQQGIISNNRNDEAYRLHSLNQNLAMERERQRALLMEWVHKFFASFNLEQTRNLPSLSRSEFGLWLYHKARIVFEDYEELNKITEAVSRVDTQLVPAMSAVNYSDRTEISRLTHALEQELTTIKFCLNTIFDAHLEIENGRDPLTMLLNRRFLPSILKREIALQNKKEGSRFCILMLDIDHFKKVNDTHGHDAGDIVLQQVAQIIVNSVRPSDFVFRFGGEEILIVIVESDLQIGQQVAEGVRTAIEQAQILITNNQKISVTASIGIASHDDEIDYQKLISKADAALYDAKQNGRNIVKTASSK